VQLKNVCAKVTVYGFWTNST